MKKNLIKINQAHRTLILRIEYDGTEYAGWQYQKNAPTVQEAIENTLEKLCGFRYSITGAGRTDAGVHARGQVASVVLNEHFTIPEDKIQIALNSNLPKDIRINSAMIANFPFHARFDAIAREYIYFLALRESVFDRRFTYFYPYPFAIEKLLASAAIFKGKHDFTTFSKFNPDTPNSECNVKISRWKRKSKNLLEYRIKADRFIYGMVRSIVGVMFDAARGKRSKEEIKKALDTKDRSFASPHAPACGLTLEKVYYGKYFLHFKI
ncbi:MAG: tRNA pseudouridine38-40 synthase [Bacteroidota bacterium]|nr:tRNA pseudouridine38-40 synthase [Bacteroidota bacterium]